MFGGVLPPTLLGDTQIGLLPSGSPDSVTLLAELAFGLILLEFGYGISLRWLKTNSLIGVTGLLEAAATFGAVYAVGPANFSFA